MSAYNAFEDKRPLVTKIWYDANRTDRTPCGAPEIMGLPENLFLKTSLFLKMLLLVTVTQQNCAQLSILTSESDPKNFRSISQRLTTWTRPPDVTKFTEWPVIYFLTEFQMFLMSRTCWSKTALCKVQWGNVVPQLWTLCYRSYREIFVKMFDGNVSERKRFSYIKGY